MNDNSTLLYGVCGTALCTNNKQENQEKTPSAWLLVSYSDDHKAKDMISLKSFKHVTCSRA